jgi:hypothetical protein
MAELRRLQTERHFRLATLEGDDDVPTLGLTSTQNLSKSFALDAHRQMQQRKLQELATVENIIDATLPPRAPETPASTPRPANPFHAIRTAKEQIGFVLQKSSDAPVARNAQCPCKSGEKYKRCCGRTAPPILGGLIPAARHAIQ